MSSLGRVQILPVVRDTPQGLYLDAGGLGEVLLPGRLVPEGVRVGGEVEVFLYRDSEDRLVATTERPKACVGGFARMRVKDVHDRAGAFLDWGLSKDLLLPFREQKPKVRVGQDVVVAVTIDEDTDRIIASTFLHRYLDDADPPYGPGDEVELLVYGETDLGYNAIVDGRFRGLIYRSSLAGPLRYGATMPGFVKAVREDGKIDLSLDAEGYGRIAPLAQKVLDELARVGGRLNLDDSSDPADIRHRFGVSKKAFKQALGSLYRARRIRFLEPGIELLAAPGHGGR